MTRFLYDLRSSITGLLKSPGYALLSILILTIGRAVRVNGAPATVIGVMPEGFRFPFQQDVWVPLTLETRGVSRGEGGLNVFGRLKIGISRTQADGEMSLIAERVAQDYPESNANIGAVVKPNALEVADPEWYAMLWTMFAAVLTVLAIACANVANLTLARMSARRREFAIRTALGAGRWRLVGTVTGELMLLSAISVVLGYGLSEWAGLAAEAYWESGDEAIPYWIDFGFDWRYALFAVAIVVFSAVLSGLLPALRATRIDINSALKDGGHGTTGNPMGRLRQVLVIGQIALSCMLLVSAGLMVRSLVNLGNVDVGAYTDNILTARLGLFEEAYPEAQDRRTFFTALSERLAALPGAKSVTLTTSLPGTRVSVTHYGNEAMAGDEEQPRPSGHYAAVDPLYFDTFDIPLLAGRDFDSRDRFDTRPVTIVNRTMAERLWPGTEAVGRQLWLNIEGGRLFEVVGVVEHVYQGDLHSPPRETAYIPLAQADVRFISLAVRTQGAPMRMANPVRAAVTALDPDLPLYWVRTLNDWAREIAFLARFLTALFAAFAAIAVILAAAGLFAVLSYSIGQRTQEIGLRRTLGATNTRICTMVLAESLRQLGIGLGIGLLLAAGFAQLLTVVLVDITPFDPMTFASVGLLLIAVTLLATTTPLLRALRVDPAVALRYE